MSDKISVVVKQIVRDVRTPYVVTVPQVGQNLSGIRAGDTITFTLSIWDGDELFADQVLSLERSKVVRSQKGFRCTGGISSVSI